MACGDTPTRLGVTINSRGFHSQPPTPTRTRHERVRTGSKSAKVDEKGSVENLVKFVKNGFFKVRRFHDRADLDAQLTAWHHEVNEVRPCRATGVTPSARIAEERTRLRPLPIPSAAYALRFPV
ncbi:IS21 ORF1, partial [mine drainage metagenome]